MPIVFAPTSNNESPFCERIGLVMAILTIIATFIVGGFPFFGYSPRTYVLLIGGSFGCWWLLRFAEYKIKESTIKLLVVYGVFVVWLTVAYLWHGLAVTEVLRKIASTHVLAVLTFFSILPAASSRRFRNIFLSTLTGIILTSGFVAIMQWLQVGWAWELARALNTRFVPLWGQSSPGFSMNSVSLSYQILLIAPFLLAFILPQRTKSSFQKLLTLLLSIAVPAIAIVTQSRSLLGGLWLSTIFMLLHTRFAGTSRAPLAVFLAGLALASTLSTVGGVVLIKATFNPAWLNPSLLAEANQQITTEGGEPSTSDAIRLLAVATTLNSTDSLVEYMIGSGPKKYVANMNKVNLNSYPHNVFLNVFMISGIPGMILLFWLYWAFVFLAVRRYRESPSLIVAASVAAFVGHFFQTQFHNDSFVFGSIYPWIILAILICPCKAEFQCTEKRL